MVRAAHSADEEPFDPAAFLRLGTVASVDLEAGTVTVETGDVVTAAIPFSTGRQGRTRIWSPPSEGEQVLLFCPAGDIEAAIALGALPQTAFPIAGNSKRELVAFEDGALLAYDPEAHQLDFLLPAGAKIRMIAPGGVEIEGNVSIAGDVSIDGDASVSGTLTADEDAIGGGKSLKSHKHPGVQPGGGQSGEPL